MSKQSSIEWLGFHLNSKLFDKVTAEEWEEINDIFKLAHRKHKEEIISAYCIGKFINVDDRQFGEQYYNETYASSPKTSDN